MGLLSHIYPLSFMGLLGLFTVFFSHLSSGFFAVKGFSFSSLQEIRNRSDEGAMISVLAQERLLGAALGSIFTGVIVFEQRRSIYRSISDNDNQLAIQSQMKEPIFGKKSRLEFAHLWNKTVDRTLGPVIASLSSRGW